MEKTWLKVMAVGLLVCFVIASLVLMDGALRSAQAAAANELVVQGWGGSKTEAEKKAFYDPFTKETGIKIVSVEGAGDVMGKVAAQVNSKNVEWDLISGYDYSGTKAAGQKGLLEKIDYKLVPRAKELIPGSIMEYGMGQELNAMCILYDHKKFPGDKYPKSWADFFDVKKFPGPRAMNNLGAHVYNILAALVADGVPPDKLTPIDFDRAFKKLDQIKPSVKLWFSSGMQQQQAMMSQEVALVHGFDGRGLVAISDGAPFKLVFNQGFFMINYWGIVKGAPHKEAAYKYLDFICRPEQQAIWSSHIKYASANPKFVQYIPADQRKNFCVHPDNFKNLIPVTSDKDLDWMTKNDATITEKWNSWLAKK